MDRVIDSSSDEVTLSAIRWQCRRGMLELDILLNTFVDEHFKQLSTDQFVTFKRLLTYPDQTLYELLMGKMVSSDTDITAIIALIRRCSYLRNL